MVLRLQSTAIRSLPRHRLGLRAAAPARPAYTQITCQPHPSSRTLHGVATATTGLTRPSTGSSLHTVTRPSPSYVARRALHASSSSLQGGLPPRGGAGGGGGGSPIGNIFGQQQKKPGETLAEAGVDLTQLAAQGECGIAAHVFVDEPLSARKENATHCATSRFRPSRSSSTLSHRQAGSCHREVSGCRHTPTRTQTHTHTHQSMS